jgi:glycosyltransferase involved in cell wall biosynthesis
MTMDPELRGAWRWAVALLERSLARVSDKVVVVSRDEWRCALETGIPEGKLALIENGVDPPVLAQDVECCANIRALLGVPRGASFVGFIGRFAEQKKPERVLEAFAIMRRNTVHPITLALIGCGPSEVALKTRAHELGISNDVIWAGQLEGAAYVAGFDVLLMPSLYEGCSYVLLEALAAGVPFVSTRVGMAEELASEGAAGFICEPWDAARFSDLVLRILENPTLRAALSAGARSVAERFSLADMVDKTSYLYDALAPQRGTRERCVDAPARVSNT